MIVGNLADYSERDFAYSENLRKAFKYLNEKGVEGLLAMESGKHVIDEKGEVYLNHSTYVGKEEKDAKIEKLAGFRKAIRLLGRFDLDSPEQSAQA